MLDQIVAPEVPLVAQLSVYDPAANGFVSKVTVEVPDGTAAREVEPSAQQLGVEPGTGVQVELIRGVRAVDWAMVSAVGEARPPAPEARAARDADMVQVGRLRAVLWMVERRGLPLPNALWAGTTYSPLALGLHSLDDLRWWLDALGGGRLLLTRWASGSAKVAAETESHDLGRLDLTVLLYGAKAGEAFRDRPVDSLDEVRGLLYPPAEAVSQ